jgi:hypothetical protein
VALVPINDSGDENVNDDDDDEDEWDDDNYDGIILSVCPRT